MITPPLAEQIELDRERMWRRDEGLRVESAVDAERFIEDVGFVSKQKAEGRRQKAGGSPQGTNSIKKSVA